MTSSKHYKVLYNSPIYLVSMQPALPNNRSHSTMFSDITWYHKKEFRVWLTSTSTLAYGLPIHDLWLLPVRNVVVCQALSVPALSDYCVSVQCCLRLTNTSSCWPESTKSLVNFVMSFGFDRSSRCRCTFWSERKKEISLGTRRGFLRGVIT